MALGAAVFSAGAYYLNRKSEKTVNGISIHHLELATNRNSNMAMTVYYPASSKPVPLAVMVAGFNDDLTSGQRFIALAEKLAEVGIASVMFEHAGCGESKESFENYTLTNNIVDLEAVYSYMLDNYRIDSENMALIGYSMGGREAVLYSRIRPEFKTMVLLAPALSVIGDGYMEAYFGGKLSYKLLEATARRNGYAEFVEEGRTLKLSKGFFDDLREYDPLSALSAFEGSLLYVQGNEDEVVPPEVSGKALQYLNHKAKLNYAYLDHIDHSFYPEDNIRMVNQLSEYLIKKL